MALFELVIALLFVGAVLAAWARRVNAPYPALLWLTGAALALLPKVPSGSQRRRHGASRVNRSFNTSYPSGDRAMPIRCRFDEKSVAPAALAAMESTEATSRSGRSDLRSSSGAAGRRSPRSSSRVSSSAARTSRKRPLLTDRSRLRTTQSRRGPRRRALAATRLLSWTASWAPLPSRRRVHLRHDCVEASGTTLSACASHRSVLFEQNHGAADEHQ